MASYWAAYAWHGLLLDGQEMSSMMAEYRKQNPAQEQALNEALEDIPFDEIRFVKGPYAGKVTDDVQITEDGAVLEKCFSFYEISDDFCQGPLLTPFYKTDGTMNVPSYDGDGDPVPTQSREPDLCEGPVYLLEAEKDLCSAACFVEKPYPSYQAYVAEFMERVGAYLPEDFDWDAHLGNLTTAIYA